MTNVKVNYPTYLQLGFDKGNVVSVNGKELNKDGVNQVLSYICREVDVRSEDLMRTAEKIAKCHDDIKLKLYKGTISEF